MEVLQFSTETLEGNSGEMPHLSISTRKIPSPSPSSPKKDAENCETTVDRMWTTDDMYYQPYDDGYKLYLPYDYN